MLGEASRLSSPTINSVTVHHEKVHCCLYMAFHLLGCTDKSLLNLSDCHSYIFSSSSCCLQTNAQTQGFVALNAALHYICHFQSLFLMEFRWLLDQPAICCVHPVCTQQWNHMSRVHPSANSCHSWCLCECNRCCIPTFGSMWCIWQGSREDPAMEVVDTLLPSWSLVCNYCLNSK